MTGMVRTQTKYKTPIDRVFQLDLGTVQSYETALSQVGMNFQIMDDGALLEYQVVGVFKDLEDGLYYALCRELILEDNI